MYADLLFLDYLVVEAKRVAKIRASRSAAAQAIVSSRRGRHCSTVARTSATRPAPRQTQETNRLVMPPTRAFGDVRDFAHCEKRCVRVPIFMVFTEGEEKPLDPSLEKKISTLMLAVCTVINDSAMSHCSLLLIMISTCLLSILYVRL